jgi:hypothetical protein
MNPTAQALLPIVCAVAALLAPTAGANAQVPAEQVEQFALAQRAYWLAQQRQDGIVAAAAAMLLADAAGARHRGLTGQQRETEPGPGALAAPGWVTPAAALALSRQLAGVDRRILALVEDVAARSQRGNKDGPQSGTTVIPADGKRVILESYRGNERAIVHIVIAAEIEAHVTILDEYERAVCEAGSPTLLPDRKLFICEWFPAASGPYRIVLSNRSHKSAEATLLSN